MQSSAIDAHFPRSSSECLPNGLASFIGQGIPTSFDLRPATELYRQRGILGDIQETVYVP